MNVLCPFCQKMQTVPDAQAGLTTACANCRQSFSVPSLPVPLPELAPPLPSVAVPSAAAGLGRSAPPPIDPGAEIFNISMEPTPPLGRPKPTPITPPQPPNRAKLDAAPPKREKVGSPVPPMGTEYLHHRTLMIRPAAVALVAPITLLLVVVFWFFSWTGAYPGGHGVYTQSALQTLYGGETPNPVGEKVFQLEKSGLSQKVSWNPMMWLYVLVTLAALAFILAPMLTNSGRLRLPPIMEKLWPWRWLISLALATTALLLVIGQSCLGFGLETAVGSIVQADVAALHLPADTPEEQQIVALNAGKIAGGFHVERTWWWRLALIAHLSAVVGLAAEWFLHRRNNSLPPRADFQW
jgi:hypothetical protein